MIPKNEIYILTGQKQSGKTTALKNWCEGKSVGGFLTPIVNEIRVAYSIVENRNLTFELKEINESQKIQSVGKYIFSDDTFECMNRELINQMNLKNDWLIVDEVGPLELVEKGFYPSLIKLCKVHDKKILLVVREGLVDDVIRKFKLQIRAIWRIDDLSE